MDRGKMKIVTNRLADKYDYLSPDGSEIRLLVRGTAGEIAHVTLPPHATSAAVRHASVEELWYTIEGEGEVWRKGDDETDKVVLVKAGTSFNIPVGTHFQFRNTGDVALCFVICTMPPWPGPDEAVRVSDYWSLQPYASIPDGRSE